MKTMTYQVYGLRDRYFGQSISGKTGKQLAKALACYAEEANKSVEFSYRHWTGYEELVSVWINRVGVDKHDTCLVEMCSSKDILKHYWPSPTDMEFIPYIVDVGYTDKEFEEILFKA